MRFQFRTIVTRVSAALAVAGLAGAVHAAAVGTAAGTTINNMATVDYSIGGVTQTQLKSCAATACTSTTGTNTAFVVDNKVDVLVTIPNTTYVTGYPGSTVAGATAVVTFSVTNNGNKTQDFDLATQFSYTGSQTVSGFASSSVTDTFNPTACSAYIQGDPTKTYIDELASGDSATITVACAIDAAQQKGDIAVIALKATALTGGTGGTKGSALTQTATPTAGEDIVFADAAGVYTTGGNDVVRDGAHSALNALKIISAVLKTQKTVATLCDPLNGNTDQKNIPGAFVQYTITITNEGLTSDADATDATLTQLSDTLVSTLTFDDDLIAGASAAQCVTGGTATSAAGKGFGVKVENTTRASANSGAWQYKTTSSLVDDGAVASSGTVTLDFSKLLPAETGYTAGLLKKGSNEKVTVIFNAKIN